MKGYLAFAALAAVAAQRTDQYKDIPDEAIGDCVTSDECATGEFCVFTTVQVDGVVTWPEASFCGAEADCNEAELQQMADDDTDKENLDIQFCQEFLPEGKFIIVRRFFEVEEYSTKLVASMAAVMSAAVFSL